MITNDRQYRVTRAQVQRFRSALDGYDPVALVGEGLDPVVVEAQRRGLEQQLRELERAVLKYEALLAREQHTFVASSLSEIGAALIEARVAQSLTQRELAERLGMREQQVQRYEQERYQTANLGRLAEVAAALNLAVSVECRSDESVDVAPAAAFDARKLPVRQMKKRGWLQRVQLEGHANPSDFDLAAAFVAQATGGRQLTSLHKQNLKLAGKADPYALLAWKARVLERARSLRDGLGAPKNIDPIFVRKLVSLSRTADGVVEAVNLLRTAGVIVVFEEHLPSTYLDGAALLLDGVVAVVALTLRHDRLDNFWFVLLHELGHVVCHRNSGLQDGFFDDDSMPSVEGLEAEADGFALNALIPEEVWRTSFVRFTRSRDEVVNFSIRIGVGASVVAGRIRNERHDYSLFSDLVGVGEVRKRIRDAGLMDA